MKKINPKKLNLNEIWQLYKIISRGVTKDFNVTILDEASHILEHISNDEFKEALELMYGDDWKYKKPMDIVMMFIRGLRENEFFAFVDFVRKITDDSSK